MSQIKFWGSLLSSSVLSTVVSIACFTTSAKAVSFVNSLTIAGDAKDLYSAEGNSANTNRLGGFFSDLYYDRYRNVYYGLADRGPGGGVIDYKTRVQKFSLDVNQKTGAISNFKLFRS
jgi:hypothetical protein